MERGDVERWLEGHPETVHADPRELLDRAEREVRAHAVEEAWLHARSIAAEHLRLGRNPKREIDRERDEIQDDQADRPDYHLPQALRSCPDRAQGTATAWPSTMRVMTSRACRAGPNAMRPVTPM